MWAMVVAGHVGEVLVELAEFSIFIDTLLSDCPFLVHNLYVVKNAAREITNIPSPIITHMCDFKFVNIQGDLLSR